MGIFRSVEKLDFLPFGFQLTNTRKGKSLKIRCGHFDFQTGHWFPAWKNGSVFGYHHQMPKVTLKHCFVLAQVQADSDPSVSNRCDNIDSKSLEGN